MGFARVVAWISGILGTLTFVFSMGMPVLFAGEYMIVGLIVVAMAIYFGRQDKKKSKETVSTIPHTTLE